MSSNIPITILTSGCHRASKNFCYDKFGYLRITRKLNGVEFKLAHRYVWALKNGPIPKNMCVLHKCDTPFCINVSHLFLGTLEDNNKDRHKKGRTSLVPRTNGEINGMRKLSTNEILKIRELRNKQPQAKIAKLFNISQTHVSGIQRGAYWKHVGGL